MGWLKKATRIVGSIAREVIKQNAQAKRSGGVAVRKQPVAAKKPGTAYASATQVVEYAGPLPALQYEPEVDGDADPGEVVWAWVPYEDDPTQGKDRPILILARHGGGYVAVQLTSRDRARTGSYTEDHHGRIWLDVGPGGWDRQGRDSEARLDRLLYAPEAAIRREGAALSKDRYLAVAEALHRIYVNGAR